ncbi:MarR family winged helix-turn-helix transcriptional regulator [Candidatus Poribacteria bacterium]
MGKLNVIMGRLTVVHLTWKRHLQRQIVPYGITLKQLYLLRQLARNDYLYPADIAEMLFCDRPTATVVIKNMEKRGWLCRTRDPDNKKRIRVSITNEGRQKRQELQSARGDQHLTSFDPLSCFSSDETETLEKLLQRLQEHLSQLRGYS